MSATIKPLGRLSYRDIFYFACRQTYTLSLTCPRDCRPVECEDVTGHRALRRVISGVIGVHVANHIYPAIFSSSATLIVPRKYITRLTDILFSEQMLAQLRHCVRDVWSRYHSSKEQWADRFAIRKFDFRLYVEFRQLHIYHHKCWDRFRVRHIERLEKLANIASLWQFNRACPFFAINFDAYECCRFSYL